MNHDGSVKELQRHLKQHRAAGWFIRHGIWALGYYDDNGQRIALARIDTHGNSKRAVERVTKEAIRAARRDDL